MADEAIYKPGGAKLRRSFMKPTSRTPRTDALKGVAMTRKDSDDFARHIELENTALREAILELQRDALDARSMVAAGEYCGARSLLWDMRQRPIVPALNCGSAAGGESPTHSGAGNFGTLQSLGVPVEGVSPDSFVPASDLADMRESLAVRSSAVVGLSQSASPRIHLK